ncbi:MAG: gamma-glutamylcyclotransferase family protein [Ilumatobacteraceae bacterium]
MSAWVFGYGSLAAPESIARTIRRPVQRERDLLAADLAGYARRWNYGSLQLRGDWQHEGTDVVGGVVISLGLTADDGDATNGALVRVTADELAELDWRERDYERTDVTARITLDDGRAGRVLGEPVVTYVPRASAVERYEQARDDRRGAVRRSYWDLVHQAFDDLGAGHLTRFRATPPPDVPIADIKLTAPT